METNKECSTGILIDFEGQGNNEMGQSSTAAAASVHKNVKSETETSCMYKCTIIEKKHNADNSPVEILQKVSDLSLETENELYLSKSHFETPSPQSMEMISKEACKIIEKLYLSPLENTEAFLDDEEFPVPYSSSEVFDEYSQDFENLCNTSKDSNLESIPVLDVPSSDSATAISNVAILDTKSVPGNLEKGLKHLQELKPLKDTGKERKAKTVCKKFDVKIPEVKHGVINKENVLQKIKTTFIRGAKDKGTKNISDKNVLGVLNVNDCRLIENKYTEKSLNETKISANIVKKNYFTPKKTNLHYTPIKAEDKTANTMLKMSNALQNQAVSCEKSLLGKSTSIVVTPAAPKSMHQINSVHKNFQKSDLKALGLHSKPKAFLSNGNSLKKISNSVEANSNHMKSKMFNNQIPSTGTGFTTPLKRSNSLTKTAVLPNSHVLQRSSSLHSSSKISQISRPIVCSAAKSIHSVSLNKPNSDAFKKPAVSTSSKLRFKSRLSKTSPLPYSMNDTLPRKLFADEFKSNRKLQAL